MEYCTKTLKKKYTWLDASKETSLVTAKLKAEHGQIICFCEIMEEFGEYFDVQGNKSESGKTDLLLTMKYNVEVGLQCKAACTINRNSLQFKMSGFNAENANVMTRIFSYTFH